MMPLAAKFEQQSIEVTKMVLGYGAEAMESLQHVGVGIASVFLLFVIFRYVSAILNGGRFEVKMLLPLLIYLMVCNFNLVCRPVVGFTNILQRRSVEACRTLKANYLDHVTKGHFDKTPDLLTAYIYCYMDSKSSPATSSEARMIMDEPDGDVTDQAGTRSAELNGVKGDDDLEKKEGWFSGMREALSNFWRKNVLSHLWSGWLTCDTSDISVSDFMKIGITALLASILQFLCSAFSIVLSIFGAVMTGILVAFGPITFAFGVFPGNGKVIGSWLIRLCQYSLYAPIAALVDSFAAIVLGESVTMAMSGTLLIVAVLICNLVALTAIPSIASFIIEGASGAVSLSSGLQSIGSGLTAAGSVLASPANLGKKGLDLMNDVSSMKHHGREKNADENELDCLREIRDMMASQSGTDRGDSGPKGLQTNK